MRYLIPAVFALSAAGVDMVSANSDVRTAVNKAVNGGAAGTVTSCGRCHANGGDGYSDLWGQAAYPATGTQVDVYSAWGASLGSFNAADLAAAPACAKVDALRAAFGISGSTCPAAANAAPVVAAIGPLSGQEGTAFSYQATATDADAGDTISSWSLNNASAGLSLNISNTGLISGTLPAAGNYSFSVTATDNHGNVSTPVTANLTVTAATSNNNPPVVATTATNNSVTVTVGAPIQFDVTASDPDQSQGDSIASLTASGSAIDAGGQFANGSFTWVNAPQGNYSVTFLATDTHGASASATVSISVEAVANQAPTLNITPTGSTVNVTEGKDLVLNIVTTDPDGDNVVVTAKTGTTDLGSHLTQDPLDSSKWTFTWTAMPIPTPDPLPIVITATDQPEVTITTSAVIAKSTSQTVNVLVNKDTGSGTGAITAVNFSKAVWNQRYRKIAVAGTVTAATGAKVAGMIVTITDQAGNPLGTAKVTRRKTWSFAKSGLSVAPCAVTATVDGISASTVVTRAPASCTVGDDDSSDDDRVVATTTSDSDDATTSKKKKKKSGKKDD